MRTPLGTVLHTGDWKIDPTPVIGPPTDEAKLRALGDEGCLALVGDSTNAVREGRSPSEADVAKTLAELIANAPAARRGHDLRVERRAHPRRRRRGARPASARSWWSAAPWSGSSQVARETGYLDGVQDFRGIESTAICRPTRWWRSAPAARASRAPRWRASPQDEHPDVTLSTRRPGDFLVAAHSRATRRRSAASSTAWSSKASRSSPTAPIWSTSPAIRAAPSWRT